MELGKNELNFISERESVERWGGGGGGGERLRGTCFNLGEKQNKVGREQRPERSGLPLVPPHFIACPSAARGQAAAVRSGQGGEDRETSRLLSSPRLSSQHLTSWRPLFLKHTHTHTHSSSLAIQSSVCFPSAHSNVRAARHCFDVSVGAMQM